MLHMVCKGMKMKYLCLSVILLNLFVAVNCAEAQESDAVLDKMYSDILKSMPQSQREIFDSAYTRTKKNNDSIVSVSADHGNRDGKIQQRSNGPEALNTELQKMMQQIDTMRNRRMIHFKYVNPVTE